MLKLKIIFLLCLSLQIYTQAQTINSTDYLPDTSKAFVKRYLGKQMPDFELKDIQGNLISSKQLRGKYLHINLWSVTCKACIEEFPELDSLKEKYQKQNVVFIAIAPESEKKVNRILGKHPVSYLVIAEAKDYFDTNKLHGYPKNLFVNPEGKVIYAKDGSNYVVERKKSRRILKPDNFRFYEYAMQKMLKDK